MKRYFLRTADTVAIGASAETARRVEKGAVLELDTSNPVEAKMAVDVERHTGWTEVDQRGTPKHADPQQGTGDDAEASATAPAAAEQVTSDLDDGASSADPVADLSFDDDTDDVSESEAV